MNSSLDSSSVEEDIDGSETCSTEVNGRHLSYRLEFIVMEHGFQGEHEDVEHLGAYVQEEQRKLEAKKRKANLDYVKTEETPRHFIVLNHRGNDGMKCFSGIAPCARKLADFTVKGVHTAIQEHRECAAAMFLELGGSQREGCSSSSSCCGGVCCGRNTNDVKEGDWDANAAASLTWELTFHVFGFSMGGLIVRGALPTLQSEMEKRYGCTTANEPVSELQSMMVQGFGRVGIQYSIEWKNFFSVSSPHLGSRVHHPSMASSYKLVGVMDRVGLLPTVLEEMMMKKKYMEEELQRPTYLRALKKFSRKVFFGAINDTVVWNYSSCFFLPLKERYLLDGWIPPGVERIQYEEKVALTVMALRQEKLVETTQQRVAGVLGCQSVWSRFGMGRPAEQRKSVASSYLEMYSIPWALFPAEEKNANIDNMVFLHSLGLQPASTLADLQRNGLIISQYADGKDNQRQESETSDDSDQRLQRPASWVFSPPQRVEEFHSSSSTTHQGSWITEQSWPSSYLSREREMGIKFLREVGPIQLHLVDMMPITERYLDERMLYCVRQGLMSGKKFVEQSVMRAYLRSHMLMLFPYNGYEEVRKRKRREKLIAREKEKIPRQTQNSTVRKGGVTTASSVCAAFTASEESLHQPQPHYDLIFRFIAIEIVN